MDASARESLREFCERRAKELHEEARQTRVDEVACEARAIACTLAEIAIWCRQYPTAPHLDDIMSGPDLEQMGAAMAGDAAEMEEQCSACGLGIAGLVRCSRDDCPHDAIRREAKR